MIGEIQRSQTASGKLLLIVGAPCKWEDFQGRAQEIADHLHLTPTQKIHSVDTQMWLAHIHDAQFCISWDIWTSDVSIMAWKDTPDSVLERLLSAC